MTNLLCEIPLDDQAVDRMEAELASSPNTNVRALLIETLADRYKWIGMERDVELVRTHLRAMPEDRQSFGLAFLAGHDRDVSRASKAFLGFVKLLLAAQESPPTSDFAWWLYLRYLPVTEFLEPDDALDLQSAVSRLVLDRWPESLIGRYENSQVSLMCGSLDNAKHKLSEIVSIEPSFWIASFDLATVYAVEEDWKRAVDSVAGLRTLDIVKRDPILCYQVASICIRGNQQFWALELASSFLDILEQASNGVCFPSSDAILRVSSRLSDTIGASEEVQRSFAEMLADESNTRWGDSAISFFLAANAAFLRGDARSALAKYADANLSVKGFWFAAVWAAKACLVQNNLKAAVSWYHRALNENGARAYPSVWFDAAWCFGKAKENTLEIDAYEKCLACYPRFDFAKNNLGWAFLKAGRLEEAEPILREALTLEHERPYAIWNLSRVLKKLGRFPEAIDVLREDKTTGGTVRAAAAKEILRLQDMSKVNPASTKGRTSLIDTIEDNEVDDNGGAKGPKQQRGSVPKENILEAIIERRIRDGEVVFKRNLRMFQDDDGQYGRQFRIPDVGFIDLLAEDVDTGDLLVIELKRGGATRDIVGQVCDYAGWIKANLAKPRQRVVPIICLHRADERLKRSAEIAGIEVFVYEVKIELG